MALLKADIGKLGRTVNWWVIKQPGTAGAARA